MCNLAVCWSNIRCRGRLIGAAWSAVVSRGQSRSVMVSHGQPWSVAVNRSQPRSVVVSRGQSWSVMVSRGRRETAAPTRRFITSLRDVPAAAAGDSLARSRRSGWRRRKKHRSRRLEPPAIRQPTRRVDRPADLRRFRDPVPRSCPLLSTIIDTRSRRAPISRPRPAS